MAFNINKFRSEFRGDGARPTLFEVVVTPPQFGFSTPASYNMDNIRMMTKAATLPTSTIGMVEVPYFGRKIKVAGDRTFDDWTMTVINDENFQIRNFFEYWHNAMDQYTTNAEQKRVNGANENPYSYVSPAIYVNQYGKQGEIVKTYTLVNAFPYLIGQVDVSWEANDQIEEFDITWAMDYFVVTEAGQN